MTVNEHPPYPYVQVRDDTTGEMLGEFPINERGEYQCPPLEPGRTYMLRHRLVYDPAQTVFDEDVTGIRYEPRDAR